MAEKEERILVLQGTGEYLCNKLNDDIPCKNKYNCLECKLGIPRSEAIERMANAMCKSEGIESRDECIYMGTNNCETMLGNWHYRELAEAALNALLEEHK